MATPAGTRAPIRLGSGLWLAVIALVMFRSLVWVFWEQSYFNSDQAVIGLMGKHLSQLRALPLLFYGQHYMLAVEAWIAAPVFLVFGISVATLKLPLVAINVAIGILLLRVLIRDVGLTRAHAFVASLFFLLPPPIAASRLVEAQGGNVEPLLYTVLLWMTRANPIAFGLIAGVGTMHREFTVYAVAAIFLLEAWHGTLFTKSSLRGKAIVLAEMAAVVLIVRFLMGHAALLGPGTAGTFPADVASGQTKFWVSRFCWDPAALGGNLAWLFQRNLATLFGWRVESFSDYVHSTTSGGHVWALGSLVVLLITGVIAAATRARAAVDVAPSAAARGLTRARVSRLSGHRRRADACRLRDGELRHAGQFAGPVHAARLADSHRARLGGAARRTLGHPQGSCGGGGARVDRRLGARQRPRAR